jgi:alpha-beta hydrolase superfamily lysophospholipase
MSSDSYLSPLTAGDGENIAIHDWPLPDVWPDQAILGTVIIVHGLGEHAFRYAHVAERFNRTGYHVRAYDQYGHGESGGKRGAIPTDMRLVDDLADVVDDSRRSMRDGQKLYLLGHSMGGVVVASFARQQLRPVDGIILSSPALDPGLSAVQKFLLATLPRLAPNLRVDNGLEVSKISRDPLVVKAYQSDTNVHRKVSGRLARFIAQEGARCIAAASDWRTPTLLLYAGSDALVSPNGSRTFAANAHARYVKAQCFDPMYHEIFNDTEREQVFAAALSWLDHQRNVPALASGV